jgi:hypothetical protein
MTFTETPRFEIWVSARCYIRISSKEIAFNNLDDSENIPQPHWHYYGCWGNNKTPITQALRNENYIGAIEQLIASAKNLNWADPPVIDTLRSKLTGSYTRLRTIKDLSTGEFISYEVACDIINKIKGEKTNA